MSEKFCNEVKQIAHEVVNFDTRGRLYMKENKYDDNIFFEKYSEMRNQKQTKPIEKNNQLSSVAMALINSSSVLNRN